MSTNLYRDPSLLWSSSNSSWGFVTYSHPGFFLLRLICTLLADGYYSLCVVLCPPSLSSYTRTSPTWICRKDYTAHPSYIFTVLPLAYVTPILWLWEARVCLGRNEVHQHGLFYGWVKWSWQPFRYQTLGGDTVTGDRFHRTGGA